jgi:hypothetical protein
MHLRRWLGVVLCVSAARVAAGQAATEMPKGMSRVAGLDAGSGILYALITVEGRLVGPAATLAAPPPRLTAQCTRDGAGKLRFELMMDVGEAGPMVFYPPWKQTKDELFEPQPVMVNVSMEFLGYTKVKPVKRQWGYVKGMPEELKYGTPGLYSNNLEQVNFYLQYLRSLPTLRLGVPGKPAVEFETLAWQALLRAEPLCRASGL